MRLPRVSVLDMGEHFDHAVLPLLVPRAGRREDEVRGAAV